jgi:hypothetical protein
MNRREASTAQNPSSVTIAQQVRGQTALPLCRPRTRRVAGQRRNQQRQCLAQTCKLLYFNGAAIGIMSTLRTSFQAFIKEAVA